ncbi:hypothetical protein OH458_21255 [Vibrio sp. MarTm2]|uniref:hypothetical protein n=1 Tax=Vibrio sp. MarTm2 TaxID=2998831 RepID=UPI0022CD7774|nr:hypothetical protein [Vibrio sp. MarTm2]MDA0130595.1 hypothetical protein [Vibrio sp. MarTm2]
MSPFQEVNHKPVLTWPPEARNTKRVNPLPCPMRQPAEVTTSALSFQPQRKTMPNCRGSCQAEMLIDQEPKSDFKPEKPKPSQLDLKMKQPTNIGMFYSRRNSRT